MGRNVSIIYQGRSVSWIADFVHMYHDSISQFSQTVAATAEALVVLATIHPRVYGNVKGSARVYVRWYCGGTFYPPTHHGTWCLHMFICVYICCTYFIYLIINTTAMCYIETKVKFFPQQVSEVKAKEESWSVSVYCRGTSSCVNNQATYSSNRYHAVCKTVVRDCRRRSINVPTHCIPHSLPHNVLR